MKAVCYCAVSHALWHDSTHASMWLRIAAAVRFAFHALHRPAELYNLVRRNLKLPAGSLLGGAHVAVAIAIDPKNRAFMGRLQVRMVRDDSAIAWLNWVTQGMLPGSHIWPMSYRCFRDCLSHCLGSQPSFVFFFYLWASWLLSLGVHRARRPIPDLHHLRRYVGLRRSVGLFVVFVAVVFVVLVVLSVVLLFDPVLLVFLSWVVFVCVCVLCSCCVCVCYSLCVLVWIVLMSLDLFVCVVVCVGVGVWLCVCFVECGCVSLE